MSKAKDVEKRYREIMVGRSVDERAMVIFGQAAAAAAAMAEIASNEQRLFEDPEHAFRTAAEAIGAERAREILGEMAPRCASEIGRTEMATHAADAFGFILGAYKPMVDQIAEVRGLAPPLASRRPIAADGGHSCCAEGPCDCVGRIAAREDEGDGPAPRPKYADRLRQIRQEKGE